MSFGQQPPPPPHQMPAMDLRQIAAMKQQLENQQKGGRLNGIFNLAITLFMGDKRDSFDACLTLAEDMIKTFETRYEKEISGEA